MASERNLRSLLVRGAKLLKEGKIEAPAKEAGVILSFILKKDISFVYANGEQLIDNELEKAFLKCISKRIEGIPLQYITGIQEFMSLPFYVNKYVLIPRHETEILVESVLDILETKHKENSCLHLLDIGTGSGCIAISIAKYYKNIRIKAVDILNEILKVAEKNAKINGVNKKIQFVQGNIFDENIFKYEKFNFIVSNPPYIPTKTIIDLQKEVQKEPIYALDGGDDGLIFFRTILKFSKKHLAKKGYLIFEVGINQAYDVKLLLEKEGFIVKIKNDYSGIQRVVIGYRKYDSKCS